MTPLTDGRRRQYVPVSTHLFGSKTGAAILERFGIEGIGAFVALLIAAKKSPIHGTAILEEGREWADLGLAGHRPGFELDDLLRLLGHLKQTRRRRVGRALHVTWTQWEEWNNKPRRASEGLEKPSTQDENTHTDPPEKRPESALDAPLARAEGEGEGEGEGEELSPTDRTKETSPNGRTETERSDFDPPTTVDELLERAATKDIAG